jgi:hypothetical protein
VILSFTAGAITTIHTYHQTWRHLRRTATNCVTKVCEVLGGLNHRLHELQIPTTKGANYFALYQFALRAARLVHPSVLEAHAILIGITTRIAIAICTAMVDAIVVFAAVLDRDTRSIAVPVSLTKEIRSTTRPTGDTARFTLADQRLRFDAGSRGIRKVGVGLTAHKRLNTTL